MYLAHGELDFLDDGEFAHSDDAGGLAGAILVWPCSRSSLLRPYGPRSTPGVGVT